MPVGRPRSIAPNYKEAEALGQEYIEWVKNTPEALHPSEWYSIEKFILNATWDLLRVTPEFFPFYEQARMIFAQRMRKAAVVKEGIAHRYMSMYDNDLKLHEQSIVEHKAECNRKREVAHSVDESLANLFGNAEDCSKELVD